MRADRLSPEITPWDEWYHAIALAKPDLGGGAACERRSVQGPGHGGASPEKGGPTATIPSAQGLAPWRMPGEVGLRQKSTTGQGKGSVPDNLAGGRARPRSTWPGTPFAARLVSLPFRVSCRGTAKFVSAPVAELLHLYRACFDRIAMRKTHPSVRQRCRCDCRIADHLISSIFGLVMDLATYRQVLCGPALPSRVRQLHRGAWTGLSMG